MEYIDSLVTNKKREGSVIPCYTNDLYGVQKNFGLSDGVFWYGKVVAWEVEFCLDEDKIPKSSLYPIICSDDYLDGFLDSAVFDTVYLGSLENCKEYIASEEMAFKKQKLKNGVDKNGK